jgi:MFS family permease
LLAILITVYCLHQLLEQIATVALWTWLGDLVPRRLLGRYFGRRTVIQLLVTIAALLASDAIKNGVLAVAPDLSVLSYAVLTAVGTLCYFAALVPRGLRPAVAPRRPTRESSLAEIPAPLRHAPSRRLLLYGCWFSFFNGLTSVPQSIYPRAVLKLQFGDVLWMQTAMRIGQMALSPIIGRTSDRYGNVPWLIVSQLAVGARPTRASTSPSGGPARATPRSSGRVGRPPPVPRAPRTTAGRA